MYPENKSSMRKTAGLPDTGSISDPNLRLFLDRIRQRFAEMETRLAYYESDEFIQDFASKIISSQSFQTLVNNAADNAVNETYNNAAGGRSKFTIYVSSSLSALIGVHNNGTSATLYAHAPSKKGVTGVLGGSEGSVHWLETDECD